MKKAVITSLFLVIAVGASVWMQTRPSDPAPGKKGNVSPGSVYKILLSDETEDAAAMPEMPQREEEGVLLEGDMVMADAYDGYFQNALFIGDSRMDGLKLYGDIKEGTWFSATSLGAFNYENTSISIDGTSYTLNNLLSQRQFDVIYLNMGINDIGYEMESLKATYADFVDMIAAALPNSTLIILSNMHVTKSYSDSAGSSANPYNVTNERINELNASLKNRQNGKTIFYMDLNKLVDDATGALNPSYTFDNIHLQSPQYLDISGYLRTHAIFDGSKYYSYTDDNAGNRTYEDAD